MNKTDLAWVAGFIEGEGTFRFDSTMRVRAAQKQHWPLEKLQAICGGRLYKNCKTPKGRPYAIWELTGSKAESLTHALLPLMSPERQARIYRAIIKRKLQPRRGSLENRAQCSRAGRKGGKPSHRSLAEL